MAKVVLLDGGVSSRLEEVVGRPLHPQLWSAGEVLTAEGRAAIVVSLTRGSIKNHIPLAAPPSYASSFPRFLLSLRLQAVHLEFLRAGSEVITTTSYQASREGFVAAGAASSAAEADMLLGTTADLAFKALATYTASAAGSLAGYGSAGAGAGVDESQRWHGVQLPAVGLSCGPYGAFLADGSEYTGAYMATTQEETLLQFHKKKVGALLQAAATAAAMHGAAAEAYEAEADAGSKEATGGAGGGIESSNRIIVCFETIPATAEAVLLASYMAAEHPTVPFWISLQCSAANTVADNTSASTACTLIAAAAAGGSLIGVGANCFSPALAPALLTSMKAALPPESGLELLCYPNRGEVVKDLYPSANPSRVHQLTLTLHTHHCLEGCCGEDS